MAQIVLGLVGAGIGAYFGGPKGAMIGWSAGVTLAGVIFPPKANSPQARGRIDDLRVTGSGYGAVIPETWGSVRVGGNIIWATKLVERKRDEAVGGKGGPSQKLTTYSYFGNFAMAVCKGPITQIKRIWAEDKLIYDVSKSPATKYDFTIYTGTEVQIADPLIESHKGIGNVPAYRGMCYVVFNMLPLKKWGNRIPAMTFEVSTGVETVGSIVGDILQEVGLLPAEFDIAGGTSRTVDGFVIATRQAATEAIDPLLRAFLVDMTEYDGKLQLTARGGAADMTIPVADLGTMFFDPNSEEDVELITSKRTQEWELPFSVEVTYFDVDKNYNTGSQRAIRYTKAHVDEKLTVTLPCALTATRARQFAESVLYDQWIERDQSKVSLPPRYWNLLPTSVIETEVDGVTLRFRIVGMDSALFGPLDISLVRDEAEILIQTIQGPSIGIVEEELSDPETTLFLPFCCNGIRDEDVDSPGFYVAAAGQEDWGGVQVFKSRQGNAYRSFKIIGDSATHGVSLNALGPGTSTGLLDSSLSLDIRLSNGELETTALEDLLSGANAALLGQEIIQFLAVEFLGGVDYRLTGLIRGQRGTDYAWDSHSIGDTFLLLSEATVFRFEVDRDLIGKTVNFKAISDFESLPDVSAVPLVITGQELKPYSPVQIEGTRDGSDNLTLTWVRRARKDAELEDGTDVPLDEPFEEYEVEIWDSGFTVLMRTISGVTGPTAGYTAIEQTTDFGSPQPSVEVRVYQLGDYKPETNQSRMRGYPGEATV